MITKLFASMTWLCACFSGFLWLGAFFGNGLSFEDRMVKIALAVSLAGISYVFTRSWVIWDKK